MWRRPAAEACHLTGRDVKGLGLAAPARGGVQDVHALAAGADDIRDEPGTVAANILEHRAMRIDVREFLLHAAPARALQGAGKASGVGAEGDPSQTPQERQLSLVTDIPLAQLG